MVPGGQADQVVGQAEVDRAGALAAVRVDRERGPAGERVALEPDAVPKVKAAAKVVPVQKVAREEGRAGVDRVADRVVPADLVKGPIQNVCSTMPWNSTRTRMEN